MTRTTIEPETPEAILAAAAADIAEADARAADLAARAADGDESVTFDDLESAERQGRWARIRAKAAEKKAAKRAEVLARERYAALLADNLPIAQTDPTEEVKALIAQARPLIEQALAVVGQRNAAVYRLAR